MGAINRELIDLARKATDASEQEWTKAYDLQTKDRWVNGKGVYVDRAAVLNRWRDLEITAVAGRRALENMPWPIEADYGEEA